jgi:hypothetical protein
MANKTAMQEMYGDLIEKHIVYTKAGMINEATSLVSSIELVEHLIGKEKEQIEKAFYDSMVDIVLGKMSSPKEYYNETYGN